MSEVVDSRVVEMRFDNKQFEAGVQTTMSTLEKFKQKLNLTGASKGLENIGSSIKRVDMNPLVDGIESVSVHFSALEVMGMTVLTNITNAAFDAGKKIVSALTIDPVSSGFQEYETQINAVQTILANTSSKGTTLDQVNTALDELNHYADLTIYNFTEMTRNIGTFTAAGVDLDTSVSAIQGIANVAAVSGSTSQQASVAMYQLSQALASGTVKLQDWNSVVNAGMGGEVFQNALKETSELLGTGAEAAIKAEGSFRESLRTGWLTSDVLTETLKKFTTSGANEYVAKYTGLTTDAIKAELEMAKTQYGEVNAIKEASKALAEKSGKNAGEIESVLSMAKTAEDAATKVKTFTQLWDTLKEAAQSGWTRTWEIVIGDFEEAKELLTSISDVVSDFINKTSNRRNTILEDSMTSGWSKLVGKINDAGIETDTFNEKIKETLTAHGYNVENLIEKYGSLESAFQSGAVPVNILKRAIDSLNGSFSDLSSVEEGLKNGNIGEDVKKVQQALTDLGYTLGQFGVDGIFGSETESAIKALQEAKGLTVSGIVDSDTLNALKEATPSTKRLTSEVYALIDGIDDLGGRQMLIESFKNILQSISEVIAPTKEAWEGVFPTKSTEEAARELNALITKFYEFTNTLHISDETADKIQRTFSGLFAVLDIGRSVVTTGISKAFQFLSSAAGGLDFDILGLTATLGDYLVTFRDFLFSTDKIGSAFDLFGSYVKMGIEWLKELEKAFLDLPSVEKFLSNFEGLDFTNIGIDTVRGLANGLRAGVKEIPNILIEIGMSMLNTIEDVLGIHSPSTEFFDIAWNCVLGAVNGFKAGISYIVDTVGNFGNSILEKIGSIDWSAIDWGRVFAGASLIGITYSVKKISDAITAISAPFEGIGEIFESVSTLIAKSTRKIKKILNNTAKVLNSFSKAIKANNFRQRAKGIRDIALAIGILAAAVYALAQLDSDKLWSAVLAIGALAGILVALSVALDKMGAVGATFERGKLDISGIKTGLASIGIAMALLAATVKIMGSLDPGTAARGFAGVGILLANVLVVALTFGAIAKRGGTKDIDKAGKMIKKIATAMLFMVAVVKLSSMLSIEEIAKGAAFMSGFGLFVILLGRVASRSNENVTKFGSLVLKISAAMALMVGVVKLIGVLDPSEMSKGAAFAAAFVVFVGALNLVSRQSKNTQTAKLGRLLLSISASMVLMVGVVKLIGLLSISEIIKGITVVGAFGTMLITLSYVIGKFGQNGEKMAGTLMAASVAIGILAAIAIALSMVDITSLAKGVIAAGLLGSIMALMIKATEGASSCTGNLVAMSVAIGVMAAAVVGLSMLDQNKMFGATAAVSALVLTLAVLRKSGSVGSASLKSMIKMGLVVSALAAILVVMSKMNVGQTIESAVALSTLMLALAGVLKIANGCNSVQAGALVAMGAMAAIMAVLGSVLGWLEKNDFSTTVSEAEALSAVMIALAAAALTVSKIGVLPPKAAINVASLMAVIAIVSAAIVGLAGIVGSIDGSLGFLDSAADVLEKVGSGIGRLIGGLVGGIGAGVTSNLPEMSENFTAFVNAFGKIDSSALSGVKTFADVILELSGANFIQNLSNIFSDDKRSVMEKFSDDISYFVGSMMNISRHLSGNEINFDAIKTVANAGQLMSELQNSLPSDPGWFIGAFTFSQEKLDEFGEDILNYVKSVSDASNKLVLHPVNPLAFIPAYLAGKLMSTLRDSLPKEWGFFAGLIKQNPGDLEKFGDQVSKFATSMAKASLALTLHPVNPLAFAPAFLAGRLMSVLRDSLPEEWGEIASKFEKNVGDLGKFGEQVQTYAEAVGSASDALMAHPVNPLAFIPALAAGKLMSALKDSLPKEWGEIASAFAENVGDLGSFGDEVKQYAKAMAAASGALTEQEIDEDAIGSAKKMGDLMLELQDAIPTKQFFDGTVDLEQFGKDIKSYGESFAEFAEKVKDIDASRLSGIVGLGSKIADFTGVAAAAFSDVSDFEHFQTACSDLGIGISGFFDGCSDISPDVVSAASMAAVRCMNIMERLTTFAPGNTENFNPAPIGAAMHDFMTQVGGVTAEAVTDATTSGTRIVAFIGSLASLDTSGVDGFITAVNKIGTAQIKSMATNLQSASSSVMSAGTALVGSLTSSMSKASADSGASTAEDIAGSMSKAIGNKSDSFSAAGVGLVVSLITGISRKRGAAISTVSNIVGAAGKSISLHIGSFRNGGENLGLGLIIGINAKRDSVYQAAYNLGRQSVIGLRAGADEHSPSRAARIAGNYLGEGMVIGIGQMGRAVHQAAYEMGETATDSLNSALTVISPFVGTDMDVTPRISPVIDLTNVRSGMSQINGMMNDPSFGTGLNVRIANSMMTNASQNGANSDVVTAINSLRKELGQVGSTSYNINGITYDDGSALADAVGTIVRAARIQGRR